MPTQLIQDTFLNTYKDDYKDSDNYYKILFNNARSLQQRELNQLQSIIGNDIATGSQGIGYKNGMPGVGGKVTVNNGTDFIRLTDVSNTTLTTGTTAADIIGIVFTEADTGVKLRVDKVETRIDASNVAVLYVTYINANNATGTTTGIKATAGKVLTGTDGTELQSISNADTVTGKATLATVNSGKFYLDGHFVHSDEQKLTLSRYSNDFTGNIGFKVTEEVITTNDDENLFDNSGATLNTASPGADRHKITLTFIAKANINAGDYYVALAEVDKGKIVHEVNASSGTSPLGQSLAGLVRTNSGDFQERVQLIDFETHPTVDSSYNLTINAGNAYIDGEPYVQKGVRRVPFKKPRTATTENNLVVPISYGNFVVATNYKSKTITDKISTYDTITLKDAITFGSNTLGTARIRGVVPFGNSGKYKVYIFDVKMIAGKDFGQTKSMGVSTSDYFDVQQDNGVAELKDTQNSNLLFQLPYDRPKTLTDVIVTSNRIFAATTPGDSAGVVISNSVISGDSFVDTSQWVINVDSDGSTPTGTFGGTASSTLVTLTDSAEIDAALAISGYAQKTGTAASKTLTSTTATITPATRDGVANTVLLGKADIYAVTEIKDGSSGGADISDRYVIDKGQRDNFYDVGKLLLKGGATAPSGNVYVAFQYFAHGAGDFFSVNSYDLGAVPYESIPSHRLTNGDTIQLRDVLDFRPRMNDAGTGFSGTGSKIPPLPRNGDNLTLDEEYYLGHAGVVFLHKNNYAGAYIGEASRNPVTPTTANTREHLKIATFQINPYMLDDEDMSIQYMDNRGYKMTDIAAMDRRLGELEEVVAMNALEIATSTIDVLDSSGVNRLKSGITADNFQNHAFSDTTLPAYKAAIDPARNELRPEFVARPIELLFSADSSDNITLVGDKVMLSYTQTEWKTQPVASRSVAVNPFPVERIVGDIEMSPASDIWHETETSGIKVLTDVGFLLDTSNTKSFGNWNFDWSGVNAEELANYKAGHQIAEKNVLGGTYSNETTAANGSITTNTYRKNETQSHYISSITSVYEPTGEIIRNRQVKDYMRSRYVSFKATGLKPNTEYFAFLDGISMADWVTTSTGTGAFVRMASLARTSPYLQVDNELYTATGIPEGATANKRTDANGSISGYLLIPHTASLKILSGTKTFTLQDTSGFVQTGADKTYTSVATFDFVSDGVLTEVVTEMRETRVVQVKSTTTELDATLIDTKIRDYIPDGLVSCFMPHTPIIMADGITRKPISEIVVGDQVLSRDGNANTVKEIETPMLGKRLVYGWGGKEPFVSEEHPMMTTKGWGAFNPTTLFEGEFHTFTEVVKEELKDVVEIKTGTELVTQIGNEVISDLVPESMPEDTVIYNLLLDGDNTFYANNVLVHNKSEPSWGYSTNDGSWGFGHDHTMDIGPNDI